MATVITRIVNDSDEADRARNAEGPMWQPDPERPSFATPAEALAYARFRIAVARLAETDRERQAAALELHAAQVALLEAIHPIKEPAL